MTPATVSLNGTHISLNAKEDLREEVGGDPEDKLDENVDSDVADNGDDGVKPLDSCIDTARRGGGGRYDSWKGT